MDKVFDDVLKSKFIRSLNMLKFYASDLEYTKKEFAKRKVKFSADFIAFISKNNLTLSEHKHKKNQFSISKNIENKRKLAGPEIKQDCKKLYKKLVAKTHPDKNTKRSDETKERKLEDYKKIQEANQEYDWLTLYDLALKYDIEVPDGDEETIEWIEATAEKNKRIIERIKTTYEWKYSDVDDQKKESLMTKYCLMFCYSKE